MFYDIYLYTLCDYICCLLWRMYEMHPALSFKSGCYSDGVRGLDASLRWDSVTRSFPLVSEMS